MNTKTKTPAFKNLLKPRDRDTLTKSLHTISAVVMVARHLHATTPGRRGAESTHKMVKLTTQLVSDALDVLGQTRVVDEVSLTSDETIRRIVVTVYCDLTGDSKAVGEEVVAAFAK